MLLSLLWHDELDIPIAKRLPEHKCTYVTHQLTSNFLLEVLCLFVLTIWLHFLCAGENLIICKWNIIKPTTISERLSHNVLPLHCFVYVLQVSYMCLKGRRVYHHGPLLLRRSLGLVTHQNAPVLRQDESFRIPSHCLGDSAQHCPQPRRYVALLYI